MKKYLFCIAITIFLLAITSTVGAAYRENVEQVFQDFRDGWYGSEVYYLASFGGWGGYGDIAIFEQDGIPTLAVCDTWGKYQQRALSPQEYQAFLDFIQQNQVDALPGWDTGQVLDGIEYTYLHLTTDDKAGVYMNNPGVIESADDAIYCQIVDAFWNLAQTGEFTTHYRMENAEVLYAGTLESSVESVWKDGDDFRVLIEDTDYTSETYGTLQWRALRDGKLGEVVEQPDGITLQAVWEGTSAKGEYHDNYPWQTTWEGSIVRVESGIHLLAPGQEPKLVVDGTFSNPVVIPGTDWVVCQKALDGWQYPRQLVKINLRTQQEIPLALPRAESALPVAMIRDKLLLRLVTEEAVQQYLYDVTNDTLEQVYGDFPEVTLKGRFWQPAKETNTYYALDNQFTIGLYDTNSFTFTPLASYPILMYDNDHVWVDEAAEKVYIAVNHDLVSVPIDLNPRQSGITVLVNDRPVWFDQPPVVQDGDLLIPLRKVFESMGASVNWYQEGSLAFVNKGNTIIFIKPDMDTFSVVDVSSFDTFGALWDFLNEGKSLQMQVEQITQRFAWSVQPQIICDRILVPLDAIANASGVQIDWNAQTQTVSIFCDTAFLTQRNKDAEFVNIVFCTDVFLNMDEIRD